jgi:hypothetical protein
VLIVVVADRQQADISKGKQSNEQTCEQTCQHRCFTAGPPCVHEPTQVFDADVELPMLPNVTEDHHFAKLVKTIDSLCLCLMKEEAPCSPLLCVLLSLYESDDTKKQMK